MGFFYKYNLRVFKISLHTNFCPNKNTSAKNVLFTEFRKLAFVAAQCNRLGPKIHLSFPTSFKLKKSKKLSLLLTIDNVIR